MGYQDPGTYVNMTAYYERHGSSFVKDILREKLSTPEKNYYDSMVMDDLYKGLAENGRQYSQYPIATNETLIKLKAPQLIGYLSVIPGIYFKDLVKSEYVFQFYPLHPLWMAIFSSLFGETNGVYSLPFFALLTIIMFYRLAKVLSDGNEKVGLIAAGLLTVNPLHTFFSKFPVTEVCFLFFTVSGFYYLAAYVHDREKGEHSTRWHLSLSVTLLLCSFLTRVTGFLYMPFFYLMAVSLYISKGNSWRDDRKQLFYYTLAIITAYVISASYGLVYSFPYTMEQFGMSIGKPFVRNWQWTVPVLVAFLILLPVALRKVVSRYCEAPAEQLSNILRITVTTGMFAVLSGSAVFAFIRFFMKGKDAFFSSTIIVAISYISPFAFLVLIAGFIHLKRNRQLPVAHMWLVVFITFFCALNFSVIKISYQYYYARYLLSEVVPYSLLFVALYLGRMIETPGRKGLAYFAVAVISLYSLYFTACQFKGREADGAYEGLKKVAERVQKNDVLFVTFNDFKLLTPLKFFFDLPTFRIEEEDIKQKAGNALAASSQSYILSKIPIDSRGAELVEAIDYRQGQFEHAQHIPTQFAYVDVMKLYLYRIDKQLF